MFWNTTLHILCKLLHLSYVYHNAHILKFVKNNNSQKKKHSSLVYPSISPLFLSRNSLIIISSEQKVRYSLRPRLSRRLPIDQSFRITCRRLALFIRRLHARQFHYASNDRPANCYTSLSWTRAGVNERLHYEAKARGILMCRATFNTGERGENVAAALFSTFFTPSPHSSSSFEPPRCLCKGGLLCISRLLAIREVNLLVNHLSTEDIGWRLKTIHHTC